MSDLIIHKVRDRVVIVPCTAKGISWIRGSIQSGSTQYSISEELFDAEYKKMLTYEGLTFDEK